MQLIELDEQGRFKQHTKCHGKYPRNMVEAAGEINLVAGAANYLARYTWPADLSCPDQLHLDSEPLGILCCFFSGGGLIPILDFTAPPTLPNVDPMSMDEVLDRAKRKHECIQCELYAQIKTF